MQNIITTAGIDTAKAKLDIAIAAENPAGPANAADWQVENAPDGWDELAIRLEEAAVTRVGIEASGGYERGVVRHLRRRGFEVLVLQPVQVKAFARVHLRRAKNDRLDARLIAACAATLKAATCQHDERLETLAQHLTFVEQIEEDIARIKMRLEHIDTSRLKNIALRDLARLTARRQSELARIKAELCKYQDLARRLELVASVAGIGERTAITLIVRMPELGQISREQIAALAGLAPFDDDSGKRSGHRRIAGGRGKVRRALYAAALPAAFRWNTALVRLYRRLTAAGKSHKVALVACARKLLIYANTVLQRGTPWVSTPAET